MRPEPSYLTEWTPEYLTEWTPEEIHWLIANGIKMTGSPAFAPHHAPEEIAALTAFVTSLPRLSADDYAALTGGVSRIVAE